jgi:hypothetical protein
LKLASSAQGTLRVPPPVVSKISKTHDLGALVVIIAVSLLLLLMSKVVSFLERLYRSWSTGLITGILPVWFILVLFFFLPEAHYTLRRLVLFPIFGLVPIVVWWLILKRQSKNTTDLSLDIPESLPVADDLVAGPEVTFDLPIHAWNQDRLNRGRLIRSIAERILRDKAPVVGIVGPFGEGKTSVLTCWLHPLSPAAI